MPADKAEGREGHFAFVSGLVLDAARVKNKVYLNFGADWREDFTIVIVAHDLAAFRRQASIPCHGKAKPSALAGGSSARPGR